MQKKIKGETKKSETARSWIIHTHTDIRYTTYTFEQIIRYIYNCLALKRRKWTVP
jgi:hypothetical protein